MKKLAYAFVLFLLVTAVSGQNQNGSVYSEHEYIDKTRSMWNSFANGNSEEFREYFSDTVYLSVNGQRSQILNERMNGWVTWWTKIDNLTIGDDTPAYPDAYKYEESDIVWVQDWLRFKGLHKESGIVVDLPFHNLYGFDEDGKIRVYHIYYDRTTIDDIDNSMTKQENGTVYKNHPYIVQVRKALNAIYRDKDLEKWEEFYARNARFGESTLKRGRTNDLETKKDQLQKMISDKEFEMDQVGYPDCIYYAKDNVYVVYSWWNITEKKGDKMIEYPVMFSHQFNDEGKIDWDQMYYSTNHMELDDSMAESDK